MSPLTPHEDATPARIFLIAGEPSGDLLGASLIEGLKSLGLPLIFEGIGGPRMEAAGSFQSLFPFSELSVMGLEILGRLPQLLRRLHTTKKHLRMTLPKVLLTIDSPEFSFRVARGLRDTSIRKIHCVAPSVWAWRPGRAKKIARFLDHLLTLFPFEAPYFEREGLKTTFVGHPLAENPPGNPLSFWEKHPELSPQFPLLLLVPGSRQGEIEKLLPLFLETAHLLKKRMPELQFALPTLPPLVPLIHEILEEQIHTPGLTPVLVDEPLLHRSLFAAGTAALAASGTVTLEIALEQTPLVAAYQVSRPVEWLLKAFLKTLWVTLPNILLNKSAIPECLQEKCTPLILVENLWPLLQKEEPWTAQKNDLSQIRSLLKTNSSFALTGAQTIKAYL